MPIIALTNPLPIEKPLNWSFIGGGNGTTRAFANILPILNFYDPVFIGTINTNTALDPVTNVTADVTFSPSSNMASLLDQTAIVASSTTANDYGYIPYIIQIDGYPPLFLNMNDTITANTNKVIVRSGNSPQDGPNGSVTKNLTSNELSGKRCYLRRVLCLFELTTRPSGLNLDSSTWIGNNSSTLADQFYFINESISTIFFLRGDGTTWRTGGGTQNRGNIPVFFMAYSNVLNRLKTSTDKLIRYP